MRSLALVLLAVAALAYAEAVVAVYLDGAIDGTAVSLVQKALADAETRGAPLAVVLNTYGGYLAPMDKIVEMLINAKTPVYAYVPHSAKAVSAGAFIASRPQDIHGPHRPDRRRRAPAEGASGGGARALVCLPRWRVGTWFGGGVGRLEERVGAGWGGA